MSNELNNIIARNTDGVYEGVAIGGDRYPGTSFMDHLLRYQVWIHFLLKAVFYLEMTMQQWYKLPDLNDSYIVLLRKFYI